MSLVADQVRRLDAYLDRLPVLSEGSSEDGHSETEDHGFVAADATFAAPRIEHLLRVVRALSTTSSSQPLSSADRIRFLLKHSGIASADSDAAGANAAAKSPYENEIEWLLVSKATVQLYGVILNALLDQIIPLGDGIWYWDDVLSSYSYSSLYAVQTSPLRFWAWSQDVYSASKTRMRSISSLHRAPGEIVDSTASGISHQWSQFYGIVRDTIRERSFANIQRKVLSPVALCRSEARKKQAQLKKLREITASGLGVLMDEGLQFGIDDMGSGMQDHHDLKGVVERSIALMNMVLNEVGTLDVSIGDFEDKVFAGVEEDPELSVHIDDTTTANRPAMLARRLLQTIDKTLPNHLNTMQALAKENGRPPALVRYWLPGVIGILSSTTILRILVNRKAEIIEWITELGVTVRDFWFNWVVEPSRKVVQTIRHDETSEIAIMSRDSLKADRESLERMVVDFAMDKPHFAVEGTSLNETQIAEIRSKVAEGDVTPVLRAFEKDLRSPFVGAVRGDLVRSLLIQVQKTKVDLEVAMTGIDSLLKSQELVFGFVGLTPGVLVTIGAWRYMRTILGGRNGQRQSRTAGRATRVLRNIDRILAEAHPTESNVLSYKDHGLLLCEVHVLRGLALKLLPREVEREFLEDLDDLANIKGIQVQARALKRIRWAYARWLR
ncbi:hypothetical protein NLU13_0622 [Sarocladium strictum]|uniref:ATP synthase regulation protein NCA2 n=1 Tax=Sarocladium strictum TaxID=5046 RepID=A0AA39GPE1_SARSR|nr:hypothetical protein NLU13_0622 [Sarocladium strictum]